MSYSIFLTIDTGSDARPQVGRDWNYTSNCGPMWRAAGADLAEFAGKTAGECAPILRAAIETMQADPDRFRAMDPENGWGSYDSLLPALERLLADFQEHPKTTVMVMR